MSNAENKWWWLSGTALSSHVKLSEYGKRWGRKNVAARRHGNM